MSKNPAEETIRRSVASLVTGQISKRDFNNILTDVRRSCDRKTIDEILGGIADTLKDVLPRPVIYLSSGPNEGVEISCFDPEQNPEEYDKYYIEVKDAERPKTSSSAVRNVIYNILYKAGIEPRG